jgi:hypothetical protein
MLQLPRASQFIFIPCLPFLLVLALLAAWWIDLDRSSPVLPVVAVAVPAQAVAAPTVPEPTVPELWAPFPAALALPVPLSIPLASFAQSSMGAALLVPSPAARA